MVRHGSRTARSAASPCAIPASTASARRTPECRRLLAQKRRDALSKPERPTCRICGHVLRADNRTGICVSKDRSECRNAARRERHNNGPGRPFDLGIKADDRFGRWTALENCSRSNQYVLVRCDCGTQRQVRGKELTKGASQSCGCARNGPRLYRESYVKAGTTFNRLTVLEDAAYNSDMILCRCECATEKRIVASSVKLGLTRSCGCLSRERVRTHGFTGHPLAQTWRGMIRRCTDPNDPAYYNYGGRGIEICERWLDPWLFAEDIYREIGPRPEGVNKNGRALYSLDRWPDNDGNYEPGNVRWGTQSEQVMNQRKVSKMTRDVLKLTKERDAAIRERDALAAQLAVLGVSPTPRKREVPASAPYALFLESDIY